MLPRKLIKTKIRAELKNKKSFLEVRDDLQNQKTTVRSITANYIKSIHDNKDLNIFIEVFENEAINRANEIDEKIKSKTQGKLAGMIIAIKDNLCYENHLVTASSKILKGFKSNYSATAIERLLKEDAIIIGRVNCDEFAMGSTNKNSVYGPPLNPLNKKMVTGGSSGGSAAAVAANLCMVSLGSDTGGSVRQPASFCGVFGFKPTYSRVSRYGLISYASSFDQIGVLSKFLFDNALVLEVISGHDHNDNTSSKKRVEPYSNFEKKPNYKIAFLKETLDLKGLDRSIKKSTLDLIESLKSSGHQVEICSFPLLEYLVPTYYVLTTAEASSNLARYDGVRYGHRSSEAENLNDTFVKSRSEGFGQEVKRRIMLGAFVLSSEYQDAYYTKAQKIRSLIQKETNKIFENFDFIVTPSTPHTAFEIDSETDDPTDLYIEDIFTVHANLSGNPAISVPFGKCKKNLPFGIQIQAKNFDEKKIFNFVNQFLTHNI